MVYIDGKSGVFSFNESFFNQMLKQTNTSFDNLKLTYQDYNSPSVTFCINMSDSCNLACDYCFNPNKKNKTISLNNIFIFLDTCFSTFPNKEKYFIDLSGKGEPLLFVSTILEIKKYCDEKSNIIEIKYNQ